jgi:hypothetical protein
MKNILKNIIPLLLSIMLFSCNNTDENRKMDQDSFLSKKIENIDINNVSVNYQNSIFLEGKFKIIKPTKNQLAIYTETNDTKHVFLFSDADESFHLDKSIEKLFYLKNGIIINDDLFLGVNGNISESMNKDLELLSKNKRLIKNEGFKVLVHKWFSKATPIFKDATLEYLITETAKRAVITHEGDCEAGGEGSTGCSSTSSNGTGCSVSCGSGYYACCNETFGNNDCHCDKG